MASVKILKKEIDWMYSLALNDCFYVLQSNQGTNEEKLLVLANNIIEKHQEMRKRINHPDGKSDPKKVKQYFKFLSEEVTKSVDDILAQLTKLMKK